VAPTLDIAMLTYSVKPRGGVVHAVEVAEALGRRGHRVELFALARSGDDFFRRPRVPAHLIEHDRTEEALDTRVEGMIDAFAAGLRSALADRHFDLLHAQDCLSANAALKLRAEGPTPCLVRTVHHVDDFRSSSLVECQERSILGPDRVLCVSRPWVRRLAEDFGVDAGLVRNGVDQRRFRPPGSAAERRHERAAAGVEDRLVVLAVGGIEPRKGSFTLLEGFARLRQLAPERQPLLVVAGGATLFDYRDEAERFADRARELAIAEDVRVTGPLPPAELERLYRAGDVFACPSIKEGFGLVALEALAAELPLVASDIDVFRTFLEHERSALLTPAGDPDALGHALARVTRDSPLRERLRVGGRSLVAVWSWDASAAEHERAYRLALRGRREPMERVL
jgi:glycosyltransferase-like protein